MTHAFVHDCVEICHPTCCFIISTATPVLSVTFMTSSCTAFLATRADFLSGSGLGLLRCSVLKRLHTPLCSDCVPVLFHCHFPRFLALALHPLLVVGVLYLRSGPLRASVVMLVYSGNLLESIHLGSCSLVVNLCSPVMYISFPCTSRLVLGTSTVLSTTTFLSFTT